MRRIGFIIDGKIPGGSGFFLRTLKQFLGWENYGAVGSMRYGWIAGEINRGNTLRYEIYRPKQDYDAVVFLKSMSDACISIAQQLREQGTKILFDLNVDYLTPATGTFYYEGMAPTEKQRSNAERMAKLADTIIADSRHLAEVAKTHHPHTEWVEDNVRPDLIPDPQPWSQHGKLPLLWSGEAVKLFELLKIESVLRRFASHVKLVIVTNSLEARKYWFGNLRERMDALLSAVETEFQPYHSIPALMKLYAKGGVFVSPRFLDNSYNLGHTEWKITLPMACGRFTLCCPVPSYEDVAGRSGGKGLRVCKTEEEWSEALELLLSKQTELSAEEDAAREVVKKYYTTPVVAQKHMQVLEKTLAS